MGTNDVYYRDTWKIWNLIDFIKIKLNLLVKLHVLPEVTKDVKKYIYINIIRILKISLPWD